jgi:hypothetical protein
MSTAYKRVGELLDRWQASVALHARYLALDDEAYAKVQPWPKHQRPTKWVVEIARTRLEEMRRQLEAREKAGDPSFAEAMELMSLLTNLLGSDHIERFIPLATRQPNTAASATVRRPRLKPAEDKAGSRPAPKSAGTRAAPGSGATPAPARSGSSGRQATAQAPKAGAPQVSDKMIATVVEDAVRFLSWGREWPALAPSIARLADRPTEREIARILRAHRDLIERKSRRPAS